MTEIDPDLFRQLMGRFVTGVVVLTARTAQGRHQGMAYFMVRDDFLFFRRNDRALPLVPGDNHFHRFFQVLLVHFVASHADSPQGRFVDDIRQFGARRAGRGAGNGIQVDVVFHAHILGMDL